MHTCTNIHTCTYTCTHTHCKTCIPTYEYRPTRIYIHIQIHIYQYAQDSKGMKCSNAFLHFESAADQFTFINFESKVCIDLYSYIHIRIYIHKYICTSDSLTFGTKNNSI